jgi:signal transduction histidine kinase
VEAGLKAERLYRYFQGTPLKPSDGKARVSKDTTLTALAQLATLRLNCQRAFISLMDDQNQYMLAEATRSLSLESEDIHPGGEDDAIYLGATTLDLVWGVCPNTIKLFTATDSSQDISSQYVKANRSYYIMNDLSKIPGFEDRPYVCGWPHMRYYAEVPIQSPAGFTIGGFCVVDDKPRDSIDHEGLVILKDIANAIMDHMELIMAKQQRDRAECMIRGLGSFVEGGVSVRDWWTASAKNSRAIGHDQKTLSLEEQADLEFGSEWGISSGNSWSEHPGADFSKSVLEDASTIRQTEDNNMGSSNKPVFVEQNSPPAAMTPHAITPTEEAVAEQPQKSPPLLSSEDMHSEKQATTITASKFEEMLFRAANLIREAIGLDGTLFLDASILGNAHRDAIEIRTANSSVEGTEVARTSIESKIMGGSQVDTPISDQASNCISHESPSRLRHSQKSGKVCKVLAYSVRRKSSANSIEANGDIGSMSEATLRRMLEKHPYGRIISFGEGGRALSADIEDFHTIQQPGRISAPLRRNSSIEHISQDIGKSTEYEDIEELSRMLPGARSVLLFPVWDTVHEKWFAYSIAWSNDPRRILQFEELLYLATFGNSIVVEMSRLDTLASDKAKSDFISSISHELRSPLHGIMAGTEMLQDAVVDAQQQDLINTIQLCGSTLLDTMDNLLTFSKINDISVVRPGESDNARLANNASNSPHNTLVDLCRLVEDITEVTLVGRKYQSSAKSPPGIGHGLPDTENQVMVLCDIDRVSGWNFATDVGSWKRIVLNLLGNALKYTATGFVIVRLQGVEEFSWRANKNWTLVTLSIEDSGKGMSKEYLKHRLFKPFAQEDSFCVGTGLGLSIVHSLVKSLGGHIEVTSEKGVGTRIQVTIGLDTTGTDHHIESQFHSLHQRLQGLTVGLVGLNDSQRGEAETTNLSPHRKLLHAMGAFLTRSITSWGGMSIIYSPDNGPPDVVVFVDSDLDVPSQWDISSHQRVPDSWRNIPRIVLCQGKRPKTATGSPGEVEPIYVEQPFVASNSSFSILGQLLISISVSLLQSCSRL